MEYELAAGKKLRRQFYETAIRDPGKRRWTIPELYLAYCPRQYKTWPSEPGYCQVTPAYARAISEQLVYDGQQHPNQAYTMLPHEFIEYLQRKENPLAK